MTRRLFSSSWVRFRVQLGKSGIQSKMRTQEEGLNRARIVAPPSPGASEGGLQREPLGRSGCGGSRIITGCLCHVTE